MTSFNAPVERDMNWGPERTSIVAILALVFALPCFIPGAGIIASLLAVFALVGISGSKGRVGGTGLAIAALVLGLFGTAIWTAIGYGMWQAASFFDKQIVGSTAIVMTEIKDGEWDKVRGRFVANSADRLTPEMFETFRTSYREKFGEFEGAPSGFMEIIDGYSKLGPLMGNLKNPPQNTLPLPLRFASGPALMMLEFDPSPNAKSSNPPSGQPVVKSFPIRNLTLLGPSGVVIPLIDPAILPSSTVIELKAGSPPTIKSIPAPAEQGRTEKPAPASPSAPPEPKKPS